MKTKYTSVAVSRELESRYLVRCEDKHGNRFHIWVMRDGSLAAAHTHESEYTVYKNPPEGLKKGMAGHFDCRKLSCKSKAMSELVAYMTEAAKPLYAIADAHYNATQQAEQLARAKEWRLQRLRNAGVGTADAAYEVLRAYDSADGMDDAIAKLRESLRESGYFEIVA